MYMYMYICVYIYMYIYIRVCAYTYVCVYIRLIQPAAVTPCDEVYSGVFRRASCRSTSSTSTSPKEKRSVQ